MIWTHDLLDTPVGPLSVVTDEDGTVRAVEFDGYPDRLNRSLSAYEPLPPIERGTAPDAIRAAFTDFFGGRMDALDDLEVAPSGTPFQQRVWAALRTIPPGETRSYAWLAETVGSPKGYRAVGAANGANPIPLILPCHRVVNTGGKLGGFSGGLERKRWLLDHEAQHARSGTLV